MWTRPIWWKRVTWDIDVKCPSSGVDIFDFSWTSVGRKNRLKFVVSSETDLLFVVDKLEVLKGALQPTVLVSPMIPLARDSLTGQREWFQNVWNICIRYNLRYSLQVHKVVFGNRKGV